MSAETLPREHSASESSSSSPKAEFDRMVGFINEVPEHELQTVNVDTADAAEVALGCLPFLESLREQFKQLPHDPTPHLDNLRSLALAMAYVDGKCASGSGAASMTPRYERGVVLLNRMFTSAKIAAEAGLINPDQLKNIDLTPGHSNVAHAIIATLDVYRNNEAALQNRTVVTEADRKEAEEVAVFLMTERGVRNHGPKEVDEDKLLRRRTYTRLYQAWNALRRGVVYWRWDEDDADKRLPSFHLRSGKRKSDEVEEETSPEAAATVGEAPKAASPAKGNVQGKLPQIGSPDIPVGLPGSSPFIS